MVPALTVTVESPAGESASSIAHSIARLLTQTAHEIKSTNNLTGRVSTPGVGFARYQPGAPEPEKE
jgi:hypothetical protein